MSSEATEQLVMKYFKSWQESDWDTFRACLSDRIDFDSGDGQFQDADALVSVCKQGPTWRDVTLKDSMFFDNRAALVYEGISMPAELRMRVAELLTLKDGKVDKVNVVFTSIGKA